jgi:adenine-specific DNA-methyltransferase
MPRKTESVSAKGVSKTRGADKTIPVEDYEHPDAHRTNNPPAGLAHLDRDETPVRTLTYDPHLDPQLVWAGKAERVTVEVPAPSIHVHEELSAQKIIGSVRRQRLQESLFDIDNLDPDKAVEFYQHEMQWSNRMILGDSLMVMASLLERERMAGQVQCLYMDPPNGVKYGSNFQPTISDRSVKEGQDSSLTREPEMIQAYRDTWELGVHSYLTYMRDRLSLSRDVLTNTGSVFVQIGDENVHRVRLLMDEVFGAENFVAEIAMQKSGGASTNLLPRVLDYIIWFAKDKDQMKYRPLFEPFNLADLDTANFRWIEDPDGTRRDMSPAERSNPASISEGRPYQMITATSQGVSSTRSGAYRFGDRDFLPGKDRHWSLSDEGLNRLAEMGRLGVIGNSLRIIRYLDDFPVAIQKNVWTDTGRSGFGDRQRYVVQTNEKAVERCILMCSDPGDLVLDPTCGSGTSALVSERFGRRWITVDTSRVALSIARERLLTSTFDYFSLVNESRGVQGGFRYDTVNRIQPSQLAEGIPAEQVALTNAPRRDSKRRRVSGPFTVEALSRYAVNPTDQDVSAPDIVSASSTNDHVELLLDALRVSGIPRPGGKPYKIQSLTPLSSASALQAEGVMEVDDKQRRFAVAVGPKFGAITMGQVSDAIREAVGFDLVVFAGFAVSADAQERLAKGKVGTMQVALLLANNDLLVGDLLKNTKASQTFRLYSAPDVSVSKDRDGFRVSVEGVDTFDAATGEILPLGKIGIQAWFLDDDYDGTVFRVSQAFFPVTDAWEKLQRALKGTVDAEKLGEMHGWTSLPFNKGENGRIAVRVIAQDGNASEVIRDDVFSVEAYGTIDLNSVK